MVVSKSWQHCKRSNEQLNCTQFDQLILGKIIRPPEGRAYVLPVMYLLSFFLYFFRHAFSELPQPIALKLCHMAGMWPYFIIPLQKFGGGALPPKKFAAKNMQNIGQFWTTSDFDCKYLRKGSRYPKLES